MNAASITNDLKQAQQEREQAARMNSEKLKTEWQNYLRAESQHFKNFIAETESRCRKLMRLAVTVTALATLLASALMLATTWKTARAESRFQQLQTEIAQSQDRLAKLRTAQFIPKGQPFKAQGRIFIELKETE
jgi:type II secretory pathway component PulL